MGALNSSYAGVIGWLVRAAVVCVCAMAGGALGQVVGVEGWKVEPSEGNRATITVESDARMRIDYDFAAGAGFIVFAKPFAVELPENWEFAFTVRGQSKAQNLEFKLVDETGENVWWVNKRAFEFPEMAQAMIYRARHFEFAWGPAGAGKKLGKLSRIELALASHSGGKGTVWIEGLKFAKREVVKPYTGTPSVSVSSFVGEKPGADLLSEKPSRAWVAGAGDSTPSLTIDFGQEREFGGVSIDWVERTRPGSFGVELSSDGANWSSVYKLDRAPGPRSYVPIRDAQARYVRISGTYNAGPVSIARVRNRDVEFGRSITDTWRGIAQDYPRGYFPRNLIGEQSFWTVVGALDDSHEALINQDGAVEVDKSGFTLEPFVLLEQRDPLAPRTLVSWADSKTTCDLVPEEYPTARVSRQWGDLKLVTRASVVGTGSETALVVRYSLSNTGDSTVNAMFLVGIRPFQVNSPWQFLNTPGGAARLNSIESRDGCVVLNGDQWVISGEGNWQPIVSRFDQGECTVRRVFEHDMTDYSDVKQDVSVSAVLETPVGLEPGESRSWSYVIPFARSPEIPALPGELAGVVDRLRRLSKRDAYVLGTGKQITYAGIRRAIDAELAKTHSAWQKKLNTYTLDLPPQAQGIADSIRANLAYILINRDGPGFQPGSRSYERSWIRDGSLTATACLEFGLTEEVKQFIDWYAQYQFPSGKIPCVVDARGADPVPEHDSHGQFIYILAEYYRYTGDIEFVRKHFDRVRKAVEYIESQRATRMTDEFRDEKRTRQEPGKPPVPSEAFFGLMPESISHEGYSNKAMHSHWDNFFTLKGLLDAAELARLLEQKELASKWEDAGRGLRLNMLTSIQLSQKAHGINYIPGCVELGDFDATSTTVAINPCGERAYWPHEWVEATFDKWWDNFVQRRDDPNFAWVDYTPYELRIVGSLVMLGHRERAVAAMEWCLKDQHPQGWHHWAEIVHRDRTAGKWIGDMPHTWCGSDFIRSARTMFVYEDVVAIAGDPNQTRTNLVLFAGVPQVWLERPEGVSFAGLRTHFGTLSASLKRDGEWWVLSYDGLSKTPHKVVLRPPVAWPPKEFKIERGGGVQEKDGTVTGITTGMTIRFK